MGFDVVHALDVESGRVNWGLVGLQECIEALGGSFTIESHPGQGTSVLLRLPLQ